MMVLHIEGLFNQNYYSFRLWRRIWVVFCGFTVITYVLQDRCNNLLDYWVETSWNIHLLLTKILLWSTLSNFIWYKSQACYSFSNSISLYENKSSPTEVFLKIIAPKNLAFKLLITLAKTLRHECLTVS